MKLGMRLQGGAHRALRIKHQIHVVGGREGAVPDEPEGILPVSGAAHVGAEERSGWPLFLRVPRDTAAGQIRLVNLLRLTGVDVLIETGPSDLDALFRLVAIEQVKARRHIGRAIWQGVDDVTGQVAGAWQYRLHELARNVPVLDVLFREDEKAVGACRKAALNREYISQPQLAGRSEERRVGTE